MINNIIFDLKINGENVEIRVNKKKVKTLSIKNKNINTNEIYKWLKYDNNNFYKIDSKRLDEIETKGEKNEVKRLYNYLYDLLDSLINAINIETGKYKKDDLGWSED